ncbi:MAG: family 20 glycosylhydrolase [Clostridia bacterium]|nr:family 20 glycosylhydrolase [Clostridia bacterium]
MRIEGLQGNFKTSFDVMREQLSLDGIDLELTFEIADEMSVRVKDGKGVLRCAEVSQMNRLLALVAQSAPSKDLEIVQTPRFRTLSLMLDVSFGGPLKLGAIKEYFRYLAAMGYNQVLFYVEDMYEMPEKYAHFGYMRGRYSIAELRELDDYAYGIGIEIVPCMQTLGHMRHYLKWDEARPYKENADVLLPDDETTYGLIRDMLVAASKPFRSKRIHVGLDETEGLGVGRSLRKRGYREPLDVFLKHAGRVAQLCDELGLRPQMWNDMVFCYCSEKHRKYDPNTRLSQKVLEGIPKNMDLVYWNYEDEKCGKFMIEKNREIGNPVIFAGGVWIFGGALPDNAFSEYFHERALADCKEMGVEEVCLTVWSYGTTVYQTSLLEAARFAEHAYEGSADKLRERFEGFTGASFEAFYDMSNLHAQYKEGEIDYNAISYDERFFGDKLMWQDIMLGIFDAKLYEEPRAEHYRRMADEYRDFAAQGGKWQWLYQYCYEIFNYLSIKCFIAERIAPAYKAGDRETLRLLATEQLPALEEAILALAEAHDFHKETYLRPFGREENDRMYGTVLMRTRYAVRRLNAWLDGKIESLPELAEPRLSEPANAWGWDFDGLTKF